MEINGATSTAYDPAIERPAARVKSDDDEDDDVDTDAAESSKDKVDISPEAARLAAKEAKEADDADEDSDGDDSDNDGDSDKSGDVDEADDGKPSTAKSFAYGALGLERPEEAKARETDGYDFGRWLAAGITVGSIISILV